jgi:predicted nucleotidyltransferase
MVRNKHTGDSVAMTGDSDAAAEALFGKARRAVLGLLFGNGPREFYLRQIAELTGLVVGSVQREVARLVEAGLVERMARGNQVWFRANEHSPIYAELVGLMTKTVGVVGLLRAVMAQLAEREVIHSAFIYGSFATGDQGSSSDVDLMVIGDTTLKDLVPLLRPVEEQIGREINPTIYSVDEVRRRILSGEHFLTQVLSKPRIMLRGTEDDIAAMVGKPLVG